MDQKSNFKLYSILLYLKDGAGKACAGHKIVRLVLHIVLKLLELSIDANFGET